jgi:hypothetical protein
LPAAADTAPGKTPNRPTQPIRSSLRLAKTQSVPTVQTQSVPTVQTPVTGPRRGGSDRSLLWVAYAFVLTFLAVFVWLMILR